MINKHVIWYSVIIPVKCHNEWIFTPATSKL
jgi:hypothetical protein